MAMMKAVALVATVVMALVACSAADLYVHFGDNESVFVFSQSNRNELPLGKVFGDGQVFDYSVTNSAGSNGQQVARAQGLFYRSSEGSALVVDKEEFTILFVDRDGKYAGTSFSFSGVWVSGAVKEFPILGGTGDLAGLKGTVTLVTEVSGSVYKIQLNEPIAPRFQGFLASSIYRHLV
eukprot:TRINITY_DN41_c0_g2_i1.p1 TRINITY_DN41_c0_g2~~TRINITY_DN41_c0_g2_i1.p1  ORF type:complete len:179 (+),score=19.43 TRINITY_DN41_c0_g2_i1:130-666(+)